MARIVLVRHGESTYNMVGRFTGWVDVPLTECGRRQAYRAGCMLAASGFRFAAVYTSVLMRADETARILVSAMGEGNVPVYRTWRLNERHYGALEGLNKSETEDRFGAAQVKIWRRSYRCPPPPMSCYLSMCEDPRYRHIGGAVPRAESTRDAVERLLPYWNSTITLASEAGDQVLVVSHGNILRGLVSHITGMAEEQTMEWEMPTGEPYILELVSAERGPGGLLVKRCAA